MKHITLKKTLLASAIASLFATGAHAQGTLNILADPGPFDEDRIVVGAGVVEQDSLTQDNIGAPGSIVAQIIGNANGAGSIGPVANSDFTTNNNNVIATAIGNTADALVPLTGVDEGGPVALALSQRNSGNTITATVNQSGLGDEFSAPVTNSTSTPVGNTFDARATGNIGNLDLDATGTQTGLVPPASVNLDPGAAGGSPSVDLEGDVLLGADQTNRGGSAAVTATIGDPVGNDPQTIGVNLEVTATLTDSEVTASGNNSNSVAIGNDLNATVTDGVSTAGIAVAAGLSQLNRNADIIASNNDLRIGVRSALAGAADLIDGSTITVQDNDAGSRAVGNNLSTTANVNLSGASDSAEIGVSQELTAQNLANTVTVSASTDNTLVGLASNQSTVTNGTTLVVGGATPDQGNTVSSNAQGNIASQTLNPAANVNGSLNSLGGNDSGITQNIVTADSPNAANVTAATTNTTFGLEDAASTLSAGVTVSVVNNTASANADGNVASQTLGSTTNNTGGNGIEVETFQNAGVADAGPLTISSEVSDATFGVSATATAGGAGAVSLVTSDNNVLNTASANRSAQTLAGITNNSGDIDVVLEQNSAADIDASTETVAFGFDAIVNVAGGITGAVVNGNDATTSARGNQSSLSVGTISGVATGGSLTTIDNPVGTDDINQTNGIDTDIDASTTGVDVGVFLAGGGFNGGNADTSAPLTVDGNSVLTENVGNLQQLTGPNGEGAASVVGTTDGAVNFNFGQSNVIAGDGRSAATSDVEIGLIREDEAGVTATNVSLSVNDNSVRSSLFGNVGASALAVGGVVGGTVGLSNTQINTGGGDPQDFSSTTDDVTIGLFEANVDANVFGSASTGGNTVQAGVTANSANRNVNASGILNGTTGLSISDSQTNGAITAVGEVDGVLIGASINTTAATPLNLVASNNVVSSNVTGNALNQSLNASGLLSGAAVTTSQAGTQTNTNSVFDANTSNVLVGQQVLGAGAFTGSTVANGNTVGSTATGNASTQSISGIALLASGGSVTQSVTQSNLDSQILANTSSVRIGLEAAAGGLTGASSVVSGNSVTANATGNSASIRRTR